MQCEWPVPIQYLGGLAKETMECGMQLRNTNFRMVLSRALYPCCSQSHIPLFPQVTISSFMSFYYLNRLSLMWSLECKL